MTPKQWIDSTLGKAIDTDGYPNSQPYQCWDYFDYFCRKIGFDGSRYCANTGYVGDLWLLRDADGYHYYTDFDYIYDPSEFRDGDWVFWSQHVAIFMSPNREIGQNQNGKPYVTEKEMNWNGVLGAMRYKHWQTYSVPYGYAVMTINDHKYTLRRMHGTDKIGVLSAKVNCLLPFEDYDADVLLSAKIAGACYFQNDPNNPDGRPFGEWYGDLSSPISGTYHCVSNQNSTLFYDLETGLFGDVGGVDIDSSHNVFSPSLVFPNSKGHWEYATFVGLGQKEIKAWYTFLVRFTDGYALGLAGQEMTPQQIADDFANTDMVNISFLDGGGSAQGAFWHDNAMDYVRKTTREVPSVLMIYRDFEVVSPGNPTTPDIVPGEPETPEITPENPPESDDSGKDDEDMSNNLVPEKIPNWEDPDKINPELNPWTVILLNIANLFKVKSILTFALTGAYIALLFSNIEIPKFLETILTMVIGFYYGTQFEKTGDNKK